MQLKGCTELIATCNESFNIEYEIKCKVISLFLYLLKYVKKDVRADCEVTLRNPNRLH